MLWDCFWGHFWPKTALQLLLSVRLRAYDSNLYRCPHAMQWPLLMSPNFWVSSAEYYIGLLSLGRSHNIVRLDTCAPGSLQHAARLETSWPETMVTYLAAVVSICGYTGSGLDVSLSWLWAIVGAMPPRLIFCGGNCPHCPPWFCHLWVEVWSGLLLHQAYLLLGPEAKWKTHIMLHYHSV